MMMKLLITLTALLLLVASCSKKTAIKRVVGDYEGLLEITGSTNLVDSTAAFSIVEVADLRVNVANVDAGSFETKVSRKITSGITTNTELTDQVSLYIRHDGRMDLEWTTATDTISFNGKKI